MDNRLYTCLMIDFYGQLLTSRQYEILDMYYNNDYSLAEISEILGISRQAVSDNKNRALESLLKYEDMLQLAKKRVELKKTLSEADELLTRLTEKQAESERSDLSKRIKLILGDIVKEI